MQPLVRSRVFWWSGLIVAAVVGVISAVLALVGPSPWSWLTVFAMVCVALACILNLQRLPKRSSKFPSV